MAEVVRGSLRLLRRGSAEIHAIVVLDLTEVVAAAEKVVPDSLASSAAASTDESKEASGTAEVVIPLLDKKISLLRYDVSVNGEGLFGTLITALLLYLIYRLLEYTRETFELEGPTFHFAWRSSTSSCCWLLCTGRRTGLSVQLCTASCTAFGRRSS